MIFKNGLIISPPQTPQRSIDYTDDSYTSVTESDMSYEPDSRRRNRPSSRNTSARNIDKIIEDSEEGKSSYMIKFVETDSLAVTRWK